MIHAYLATLHSSRELNSAPSVVPHKLNKQQQPLQALRAPPHEHREETSPHRVVPHKLNRPQQPVHTPPVRPLHLP